MSNAEQIRHNSIVLFSGGLDSTYLLQTALEQGDVTPLIIEYNQTDSAFEMERDARQKIIDYFRYGPHKYGPKDHPHELKAPLRQKILIDKGVCHGFAQMAQWVIAAMGCPIQDYTNISIGYVEGDQAIASLASLEMAWGHLTNAISPNYNLPPIRFPLARMPKERIMKELHKELFELVVYCEMPRPAKDPEKAKFEACGQCRSCVKHRQALERIDYEKQYQERFSDWNQEYHERWRNQTIEQDKQAPEIEQILKVRKVHNKTPKKPSQSTIRRTAMRWPLS